MAPTTYEPTARGRIFDGLFERANDHFDRAGCQRILSHGEDNFLWHAEQAVELYENLFTIRPGEDPSQPSQKCPAQARKDNDDLQVDYKFQHHAFLQKHGRKPTREELIVAHRLRYNMQQLDFAVTFEDRYEECLQPSMEDGDDEDGNDEDEGSQNAANDEDDDKLDSDGGDPLPELNYDFDLPRSEASSQPEPSSQSRSAAVTSQKGKAS
ncbi:hypothetical protein D6D01_03063 [Aureobasidium pullulans]|uniref:Uncharacterized protein n=1 Tax=Aureobasidium pullulans TaxID=5580 RepID=A0A4S9LP25_AURPU|nr:hypothetical protein D6D01_03063 [Aureobasidium pullulans]